MEVHFGDTTLRDDASAGPDDLVVEPQWSTVVEEAFRSPQAYARSGGNASQVVKFRMYTKHTSYLDRIHYRRGIYAALHVPASGVVPARELWVRESATELPYSFGLAVFVGARPVDQGYDPSDAYAKYFTLTLELEFRAGLLALGAVPATPDTTVTPPVLSPNFWLPNAKGICLWRASDSHWVKVTGNFGTGELVVTDLGTETPSGTDYLAVAGDREWAAGRGFGFWSVADYRIVTLTNALELQLSAAGALTDYAAGAVSASTGFRFPAGTGPILRTPDGRRFRLGVTDQFEATLPAL